MWAIYSRKITKTQPTTPTFITTTIHQTRMLSFRWCSKQEVNNQTRGVFANPPSDQQAKFTLRVKH